MDEVLGADKADEALEGLLEPHGLLVVDKGQKFVMKAGDTVALGTDLITLSMHNVGQYGHRLYIFVSWSDLESGTSRSNVQSYQNEQIELPKCRVVAYEIDLENSTASFVSSC